MKACLGLLLKKILIIMKKSFLVFFFFSISLNFFAQGIAVQGIARDNASSAITDTSLTFTFSITKDDNTVLYAETESIKTDNFGVFSHIVSTGNDVTNPFSDVDFALEDLKLRVSVNYSGNEIEVYNQAFQYTPYAHFAKRAANADDGVPTGAIMPFLGEIAPVGWVFCLGQSIVAEDGSAALMALIGSNNAPNLQGLFLRGAGKSDYSSVETIAGTSYNDTFKSHNHSNTLSFTFRESRTFENNLYVDDLYAGAPAATIADILAGNQGFALTVLKVSGRQRIDVEGSVTVPEQTIVKSGGVSHKGEEETRPPNYGVNYIIKL
ncbi:MAG: microcystin-dependent protein [Polaribacter sp.]|jgi:microcystin-dependent protein